MIEGKDAKNVMPCAHQALSAFGEHAEILYHCTTLNLYKRQPGLARRSSLLAQVSASIRPTSINLSNQLAAYEMNGQTDWLGFLNPSLSEDSFLGNPQLQANLVMQLASIQSDKYSLHLKKLVHSIESAPGFSGFRKSQKDFLNNSPTKGKKLNIAWMTGDCNYHPVARFIYGWFASFRKQDCQHDHTLVNLEDHKRESYCDLFRSTSSINVHDVSSLPSGGEALLREIRWKEYDVVVDLSGWTGR